MVVVVVCVPGIEMIDGLGLVATITPVTHAKLSAEGPQHETEQKKKKRVDVVRHRGTDGSTRDRSASGRCSTAFPPSAGTL